MDEKKRESIKGQDPYVFFDMAADSATRMKLAPTLEEKLDHLGALMLSQTALLAITAGMSMNETAGMKAVLAKLDRIIARMGLPDYSGLVQAAGTRKVTLTANGELIYDSGEVEIADDEPTIEFEQGGQDEE